MYKSSTAGLTALAITIAAWAGTARAGGELNALVWCDHTDPALIEPFEKAHDVRVNLKEYEGTGAALSLVEQSQPGDWDVFVVDGIDVPRVVEAGLLAALPEDQLPMADSVPRAGDAAEPHPRRQDLRHLGEVWLQHHLVQP